MLVLARRVGEAIMIGDDVTVTVLSVEGRGGRAVVRLGIAAPRGLTVARREVYLEIQEENRRASLLARAAEGLVPSGAPEDSNATDPSDEPDGGRKPPRS
jgi:carbon storage regulator